MSSLSPVTIPQKGRLRTLTGLNHRPGVVLSRSMAESIILDLENGADPLLYESELRSAGFYGKVKKPKKVNKTNQNQQSVWLVGEHSFALDINNKPDIDKAKE